MIPNKNVSEVFKDHDLWLGSQEKGDMLRASKVGVITKGDMQSRTLIKTTATDGMIKKKTYAKQNYVWIFKFHIFKRTNLSESEILDGISNLDSFASTL